MKAFHEAHVDGYPFPFRWPCLSPVAPGAQSATVYFQGVVIQPMNSFAFMSVDMPATRGLRGSKIVLGGAWCGKVQPVQCSAL